MSDIINKIDKVLNEARIYDNNIADLVDHIDNAISRSKYISANFDAGDMKNESGIFKNIIKDLSEMRKKLVRFDQEL